LPKTSSGTPVAGITTYRTVSTFSRGWLRSRKTWA